MSRFHDNLYFPQNRKNYVKFDPDYSKSLGVNGKHIDILLKIEIFSKNILKSIVCVLIYMKTLNKNIYITYVYICNLFTLYTQILIAYYFCLGLCVGSF